MESHSLEGKGTLIFLVKYVKCSLKTIQHNKLLSLNLMCQEERLKHFSFSKWLLVTESKAIKSERVRIFLCPCHADARCTCLSEILQNSKYHYLAPPWHTHVQPQGPSICKFFPQALQRGWGKGGTIAPHFWGPKQNVIKDRVQAENGKYLLIYDLAPPPPPPRTFELAPQAFFPQVYNCSVDGQRKCDLDKGALWPKPVKNITAVSGNVDQSKLVHKLIHIFYAYW